ncbi:MAG: lytic transglycosylase domain-containing protein [Betaproteobacteria bacterium HGW-Betaproteobacteria-12]|nr:MAG: lytic transglycosylase domain-containing protein [Betaproteobacteria bacterium HGW-Betaproteobacteria-12]
MFATTILAPALQRISLLIGDLFRKALMVAGLILVIGLVGLQTGHSGLTDTLKLLVSPVAASIAEVPEVPAEVADTTALTPRMQGALDFVSRRYRVAGDALMPIFATAQAVGRELQLDPLLIIAVIGVESGFNPFSQSGYGAQGLMQVVPRFHTDKLPEESAPSAFLDPLINVQVGARVLRESITRMGGLEEGLQQFGGAANDPARRYSSKVLAEKQRLEQAALRLRTT